MKKYFLNLLTFAMAAMLSVNLTACGNDDVDDPDGGGTDDSSWVVGSWVEAGGGRKWTFKSGGACDFYIVDAEVDRKTGQINRKGWKLSQSGTWRYNAETMLLTTNIYSWNWEIISYSNNSWSGKTVNGKNSSIYTYNKE